MTGHGSVCFGGESPGAAQRFFRAELPAFATGLFGWKTEVGRFVLPPRPELESDLRLRGWDWDMESEAPPEPEPCDIITLRLMDDLDLSEPDAPRFGNGNVAEIERARAAGQIVLYDLDDDVWNIPAWSPAHNAKHSIDAGRRAIDLDVLNANIAASDGVMVTTPRIAEVVRHEIPDVRDVWVMRNGIYPDAFDLPHEPTEGRRLRVGWMGGVDHHGPHLRTMWEALDAVSEAGAEFIHFGRTRLDGGNADRLYDEIRAVVPGLRVGWMEWVPHHQVPQRLACLDIAIIPRVPTPFNEGQSFSSGLQYAAAGVPFLVSPSEEYRILEAQGAGIVCESAEDWRTHLTALLTDHEWRAECAAVGKAAVAEHHGVDPTGRRYHELFTSLMAR